jgi:dATP pyrophosphohydrolase
VRQPVSVLVYPAFYSGEEWLYLLLHRVPMPQLGLGSFWQGITGAAKKNETIGNAAKRELFEETSISADRVEPINYSYSILIQEEWKKQSAPGTASIVEHVFVAIMKMKYTPQLSREHDRWKWYNFEEAVQMLYYPGNVKGLKRCHDYLKASNFSSCDSR